MYKTVNGWTKAKMIEAIQTRMLDHPSTKKRTEEEQKNTGEVDRCVYLAEDGNHCAIGVFIPEGHAGEKAHGLVFKLLFDFPDLIARMPLKNEYALMEFQGVQDHCPSTQDPRPLLIEWINENVEDGE
jgi:hypothetical protein